MPRLFEVRCVDFKGRGRGEREEEVKELDLTPLMQTSETGIT